MTNPKGMHLPQVFTIKGEAVPKIKPPSAVKRSKYLNMKLSWRIFPVPFGDKELPVGESVVTF